MTTAEIDRRIYGSWGQAGSADIAVSADDDWCCTDCAELHWVDIYDILADGDAMVPFKGFYQGRVGEKVLVMGLMEYWVMGLRRFG